MNVFAKFSALIVTIYWILHFKHLYFVSGGKPRCVGESLDGDEFSKKEDVGFVRDICVDIIARNLYNKLKRPSSSLCEELANMRTSTCLSKSICVKWKRSNFWNKGATSRVMTKAEALIEDFNKLVSKDASLNNIDDEKFIYERINEGRYRLIKSGAASKNSKIVEELNDLKKNFCLRHHLNQQQLEYQKTIGMNDDKTIEKIRNLLDNKDFINAIKQFFRNFEAENQMKILKYHIENNVVKAGESLQSGIVRLKFTHGIGENIWEGSVILKIPSLAALPYAQLRKTNMFTRELYFYEKLLPQLYQLGKCEPFAPKLYATTQETALVLEDLELEGYQPGDRIKQLNLDESRISLHMLASYHALGYKYLQNRSHNNADMSLLRSFQPTLMGEPGKDAFDKFCQMVESSLSKSLYQTILKVENEILVDPMTKKYPNENSFTVIIHADFQTNNILFKYNYTHKNRGSVNQVKLIDWQLSREASPVLDLIYFFVTSVPIEIIETNYDALLNFYLQVLNDKLSSLESIQHYNRPELDADMAYYKYHFLKILCIIWQQIMHAGPPGPETDTYISKAIKWLGYLKRKGII